MKKLQTEVDWGWSMVETEEVMVIWGSVVEMEEVMEEGEMKCRVDHQIG